MKWCLRCFLFGHRWYSVTETFIEPEREFKQVVHEPISHCKDCGAENPLYEEHKRLTTPPKP